VTNDKDTPVAPEPGGYIEYDLPPHPMSREVRCMICGGEHWANECPEDITNFRLWSLRFSPA